jgi:NTE family protein
MARRASRRADAAPRIDLALQGGGSHGAFTWGVLDRLLDAEDVTLDVVLVKINPLLRPWTPATAEEIADRVNEITFNAGLIGEMRAIEFVQRLIAEGRVDSGNYKDLRLHMIADEEGLAPLHPSSKLNTGRDFLLTLHGLGHAAADRWLASHRADLGVRGTLDIRKSFLQSDG